MILNQKLSYKS